MEVKKLLVRREQLIPCWCINKL